MKTLYILLGLTLLFALLMGGAEIQFTAVGVALGWIWYEDRKTKRYGNRIHQN